MIVSDEGFLEVGVVSGHGGLRGGEPAGLTVVPEMAYSSTVQY